MRVVVGNKDAADKLKPTKLVDHVAFTGTIDTNSTSPVIISCWLGFSLVPSAFELNVISGDATLSTITVTEHCADRLCRLTSDTVTVNEDVVFAD